MAVKNPPRWVQAGSHDAETDRRMIHALVGGWGGIVGTRDLLVTQASTPSMSVQVASGRAFIPGTESAYQGMYYFENQGAVTLSVAAAHATLARRDLVVARVFDQQYGVATTSTSALEVLTGVPSSTSPPPYPAVPSNCWVLAAITVAPSAATITNASISDLRANSAVHNQKGMATGLGGVIFATTAGRPDLTTDDVGQLLFDRTDGKLHYWSGTQWIAQDWNSPWGYVAGGMNNSDASTSGTNVLSVMSATLQQKAGRRYRISATATVQDNSGTAQDVVAELFQGTTGTVLASQMAHLSKGYGHIGISLQAIYNAPINAAQSIQYRIRGSGGSVVHRAAGGRGPASFLIEDIGPY